MSNSGAAMAAIAERIRARRLEMGYSYQDLADRTGMNKSSLQRYESGGIANVPLHRLEVIARALEVSPEWLMGWDGTGYDGRFAPSAKVVVAARQLVSEAQKKSGVMIDAETERFYALADAFALLNDEGQQRAVERVRELAEISRYSNRGDKE